MQRTLQLLVLEVLLALRASAVPSFAVNIRDENSNDVSHLFSVYQRDTSVTSLSKRGAYPIYCFPMVNGVFYEYVGSNCNQAVNLIDWNCHGFNASEQPKFVTEHGSCLAGEFCIERDIQLDWLGNGITITAIGAECVTILKATPIHLRISVDDVFYQFLEEFSEMPATPGPNTASAFDILFVNTDANATIKMNWINIQAQDAFQNNLDSARCSNCGFDELGPIPDHTSTLIIDASIPRGFTAGVVYVGYGVLTALGG